VPPPPYHGWFPNNKLQAIGSYHESPGGRKIAGQSPHGGHQDGNTGAGSPIDEGAQAAQPANEEDLHAEEEAAAAEAEAQSEPGYREKFMQKVPELENEEGWQIHHTKQQRLEKQWKEIGVDIHDAEHLRAVPQNVHGEISRAQNAWRDEEMRKLGLTPGDEKDIKKFWNSVDLKDKKWRDKVLELEKEIEKKWGKYWLKADETNFLGLRADYDKLIKQIKRETSTKKFATGRGRRITDVLEKVAPKTAKVLAIFAIFGAAETVWSGAAVANQLANPSPEAEAAWKMFEIVYEGALKQGLENGSISDREAHQLRQAFVEYLRSIGVEEKVVQVIDTAFANAIDLPEAPPKR
jgi:phage gp16-like protein